MVDLQSDDEFSETQAQIHQDLLHEQHHLHHQDLAGSPLLAEVTMTLDQFVSDIDPRRRLSAAQALSVGLRSLDKLDRHRFVVQNYLEGLKRGESPGALWDRFREIGLVDAGEPPTEDRAAARQDAQESESTIRRIWNSAAQVVMNACKTIPEYVDVKTVVSLFPPNLSFEITGTGRVIRSFLRTVSQSTSYAGHG